MIAQGFMYILALLLAFTLAALPVGLRAQAGSGERTLFVSAVDAHGDVVEGLGPADFIVREDGVPREVLRVSRAVEPVDVALLVDNGATSADAITNIRAGLKTFISMMAGKNPIAIIGLADRPTILVDYTTDPKRQLDGVGLLFAQSRSGVTLLDAIVEVSRGLERRESTRAVLVPIVTDGIEFSNRNYRDALDALDRAGVAMHTLTVGMFEFSQDEPFQNRGFVIDEGTRVSGGQRVALLTSMAVEPTLRKLARELSSQYKVVYSRPQSLVQPEKIQISAGRPGVTMRGAPARRQAGA
jgi:VWFA-related protein